MRPLHALEVDRVLLSGGPYRDEFRSALPPSIRLGPVRRQRQRT
jgi:hypothetical protein